MSALSHFPVDALMPPGCALQYHSQLSYVKSIRKVSLQRFWLGLTLVYGLPDAPVTMRTSHVSSCRHGTAFKTSGRKIGTSWRHMTKIARFFVVYFSECFFLSGCSLLQPAAFIAVDNFWISRETIKNNRKFITKSHEIFASEFGFLSVKSGAVPWLKLETHTESNTTTVSPRSNYKVRPSQNLCRLDFSIDST